MNTPPLSRPRILIAPALAFLVLALPACGPNAGSVREKPIPPESVPESLPLRDHRTAAPQLAPPTDEEVRQTIQRVFGDDILVDRHPRPRFVAGDFNGDGSQDLLVAVKPVKEKLPDINSDVANWIVQNPRHSYAPLRNKRAVVPPPAPNTDKVRPGETLLAVIHGYGPAGWRDPMALQAYLLCDAAGTSFRVSQPSRKLIRDFGAFPDSRDVVAENLGGSAGVLFWTGAAYAWHRER
jgi:hypothetical protein